jgi:hypothetical protein
MPLAGVASPNLFWPQQVMVPSVRTPHVWYLPAETEVNQPAGAFDWP